MFRRLIMKSKEYKRLERILQKMTREVDRYEMELSKMQELCDELLEEYYEHKDIVDRYEMKLSKMQELCDELLEGYYEHKDISESISKIRKELWYD